MLQSRRLFRISLVGHIFNDMYWFIIPLLLPIIKEEFSLNYTQSGLLLSSYTMMGAFGSLITGYLGDRRGRRFILSWGFFLGSLALVLCAISNNYWHLFLSLIILGVGISAFHPSMIAVISSNFTQKRGTTLGIFQFWGWMGTLTVVLLISLLLKALSDWRKILIILSIPGFIFAPLFFNSLKTLIKEKKRNKSDSRFILKENNERVSFLILFIFILANTLFTITYYAVMNFIPTYLVGERAFNVTFASYSFLIVVGGGLFGALLSGKMSDILSSLNSLIIFVLIGGPIIIFLTLFKSYFLLIVTLVLFGISYAGIYPSQQAYLAESTPQKIRGGAYGIIFCVSYIVGAIAPGITGMIADNLSLPSALRIITLPLFLSLIFFFILKRAK